MTPDERRAKLQRILDEYDAMAERLADNREAMRAKAEAQAVYLAAQAEALTAYVRAQSEATQVYLAAQAARMDDANKAMNQLTTAMSAANRAAIALWNDKGTAEIMLENDDTP